MQSILLVAILSAAPAADTVVVCPRAFDAAMAPWLAYRRQQGHRISMVRPPVDARSLQSRIREVAKRGQLKHIVLVGDAPSIGQLGSWTSRTPKSVNTVPTLYVDAQINVLWGSEPHIATDNPYADLDDDGLPDLAIGRLAVDTPTELSALVAKILAYERSDHFGLWRRRINFVAGVGGFGTVADKAIEVGARRLIERHVPAPYATTMTYGSWRSPYCPDPREFHHHVVERLNEGCLFWVYIGHGHVEQLDRVQVPENTHHIFDVRDLNKLNCRDGLPIALFMACYTGAFDANTDCLAEKMLPMPGAPIAAIAGSRVTMPYAMSILGLELLDAHFGQHAATLGETLLLAKRNMAGVPDDDEVRPALELMAKLLSPVKTNLQGERLEHVQLFNLLGDPLLRLPQPLSLSVEASPTVEAGARLSVAGNSELAGQAIVELVVRRDRLRFKSPARRAFTVDDDNLAGYSGVYQQANDVRYAHRNIPVESGRFETTLNVPPEARGACQVRVYVEGQAGAAVGSTDVTIVAREKNVANKPRTQENVPRAAVSAENPHR